VKLLAKGERVSLSSLSKNNAARVFDKKKEEYLLSPPSKKKPPGFKKEEETPSSITTAREGAERRKERNDDLLITPRGKKKSRSGVGFYHSKGGGKVQHLSKEKGDTISRCSRAGRKAQPCAKNGGEACFPSLKGVLLGRVSAGKEGHRR